jgi:hypothetical protein
MLSVRATQVAMLARLGRHDILAYFTGFVTINYHDIISPWLSTWLSFFPN